MIYSRFSSTTKKRNVYSINERFFESWSNDMAYVLGFFAADGCMTKNSKRENYYIEFVSTDLEILEKIRNAMSANQTISEKKNINKKWKQAYRIQIGSKKIFEDLAGLGFTSSKSNTMTIPNVPKNYFHDFVRGYFDGDGCISHSFYERKNRPSQLEFISIRFTSGSKMFLLELKDKINKFLKFNQGCLHKKQKSGYELAFSTLDTLKILKYIYQKRDCLFLSRKQKISAEILASRESDA